MNEYAKKELFTEDKLKVYKKASVKKIIIEFKDVLIMYYRNETLSKEFDDWSQKYHSKFNKKLKKNDDKKGKKNDKKDDKKNDKKDDKKNDKKDKKKKKDKKIQ